MTWKSYYAKCLPCDVKYDAIMKVIPTSWTWTVENQLVSQCFISNFPYYSWKPTQRMRSGWSTPKTWRRYFAILRVGCFAPISHCTPTNHYNVWEVYFTPVFIFWWIFSFSAFVLFNWTERNLSTWVITNRRRVFTTKLLIETALKSPRLATFELKQCPQEGVNWPTLKGEKNK